MELEFDVKITPNDLYDYMMFHTYSGMSGIVGTVCGLFLIVVYLMGYQIWYLIAGLIVILYLPWTLFLRSRKQYLANASFKQPLHYFINDEGITISQGEVSETQSWENMYKAVSTFGSIVVYTSRVNASIFPKRELMDKKMPLIKMISTHMEPKKVKIRGN